MSATASVIFSVSTHRAIRIAYRTRVCLTHKIYHCSPTSCHTDSCLPSTSSRASAPKSLSPRRGAVAPSSSHFAHRRIVPGDRSPYCIGSFRSFRVVSRGAGIVLCRECAWSAWGNAETRSYATEHRSHAYSSCQQPAFRVNFRVKRALVRCLSTCVLSGLAFTLSAHQSVGRSVGGV